LNSAQRIISGTAERVPSALPHHHDQLKTTSFNHRFRMKTPRIFKAPVVMGLLLVTCGMASAHPHVWTEMNTNLAFNGEGQIEGLAIEWTFDDLYAQDALGPFTQADDGSYSEADLEALTRENIESLADYEYFTLMRLDGQKLAIAKVNPKHAQNVWKDGRLSLLLFVPLERPLDPRSGTFTVKVFDPEYYVAIDYRESEPFQITGSPPKGCSVRLDPVQGSEELQQARDFLSTKGKDWKPESSQEFGEMFAQALTVVCDTQ
jgi:ABC-type uncharacterized transport system substrate-binding protein